MYLQDFLTKVEAATGHRPKRSGGGYSCRCPGHDDTNPSLSVSESADFRLITPDLQDEGIPDISTERGQALIEEALADARLLVLDNLSTLAPSLQENEADSWGPIQSWLLKLRTQGVSVQTNEEGALVWIQAEVQDDLYDDVVEGVESCKSYRQLAKELQVSKSKIEGVVKKARHRGDLPEVARA